MNKLFENEIKKHLNISDIEFFIFDEVEETTLSSASDISTSVPLTILLVFNDVLPLFKFSQLLVPVTSFLFRFKDDGGVVV